MSLQRPEHLTNRPFQKHRFGEDAQLITVSTSINDFGEPQSTETTQDICCATAPASGNDARVRQIAESGTPLEAMRQFWMAENPRPATTNDSIGDIIVFSGERFRVRSVEPWGGFTAVIGVRIEGQ